MISGVVYFRENIFGSSRNDSETAPMGLSNTDLKNILETEFSRIFEEKPGELKGRQ